MKVFDGAKLKKFRKEAGLSQYALAPLVDVSQNRISDIERNVTDPTTIEIDAFASALNCPASAFLNDETEIEVVKNTFSKSKKVDSSQTNDVAAVNSKSEQLELLPALGALVYNDLSGYVLIDMQHYQELLECQKVVKKLQNVLK